MIAVPGISWSVAFNRCGRIAVLLALTFSLAQAQAPSVAVRGGNPTLTISTGLAGSQPVAVVNSATSLRYRLLSFVQKITVRTSCPGQDFGLSVLASSVTSGTAGPEAVLSEGMPAVDFILNIPSGGGFATATLNYTASATFAQGNSTELGDDVHTVTYTITAQ